MMDNTINTTTPRTYRRGPIIENFISWLAPHYCLACDTAGSLLCKPCGHKLLVRSVSRCYRCGASTADFRTCVSCRPSTKLFAVWSPNVYEGAAKQLVHKIKFERAQAAAAIMADRIAAVLPVDDSWLVTHAPTANARVRQRGYDQARLIAKCLSRQLGNERATLLARQGRSRQVGQTRRARKAQMDKVFFAIHQNRIRGRHILLIDDVVTTGATLEAAATILKNAGAKRISAAVFAAA